MILYTFKSTKDAVIAVKTCEEDGLNLFITVIPKDVSSECGIAFNANKDDINKIDTLLDSKQIIPIKYER